MDMTERPIPTNFAPPIADSGNDRVYHGVEIVGAGPSEGAKVTTTFAVAKGDQGDEVDLKAFIWHASELVRIGNLAQLEIDRVVFASRPGRTATTVIDPAGDKTVATSVEHAKEILAHRIAANAAATKEMGYDVVENPVSHSLRCSKTGLPEWACLDAVARGERYVPKDEADPRGEGEYVTDSLGRRTPVFRAAVPGPMGAPPMPGPAPMGGPPYRAPVTVTAY